MFPTLQVASGRDPFEVLAEVMMRANDAGEYIYHPNHKVQGRVQRWTDENTSGINDDWIDKWHHQNPEYELRSPHHKSAGAAFGNRRAIAMPSVHLKGFTVGDHHEVAADVVHTPSQKKVGEFLFSLGNWPSLEGSQKAITTAHVWGFFRHGKPPEGTQDPHGHVMTKILDSWLDNAKENGVRHGYVQGDASNGYWLRNVTRHPDMIWGGVEYDEARGETRLPHSMRTKAGTPDSRRHDILKGHPALFQGWPGTKPIRKAVGEDVDAFVMRWNQHHPKPEGMWGPIPTDMKSFPRGSVRKQSATWDRQCYHHALRNAKRKGSGLKLVAGFVIRKEEADKYARGAQATPAMISHAFNVDRQGKVVDPTLGADGPRTHHYYGHVLDHSQFESGDHLATWIGHHYHVGHDRGPMSIYFGTTKNDIDHTQPVRP